VQRATGACGGRSASHGHPAGGCHCIAASNDGFTAARKAGSGAARHYQRACGCHQATLGQATARTSRVEDERATADARRTAAASENADATGNAAAGSIASGKEHAAGWPATCTGAAAQLEQASGSASGVGLGGGK